MLCVLCLPLRQHTLSYQDISTAPEAFKKSVYICHTCYALMLKAFSMRLETPLLWSEMKGSAT